MYHCEWQNGYTAIQCDTLCISSRFPPQIPSATFLKAQMLRTERVTINGSSIVLEHAIHSDTLCISSRFPPQSPSAIPVDSPWTERSDGRRRRRSWRVRPTGERIWKK